MFFGGARGGGKTDGVLGHWALKERGYGSAFNAVMFRRTTVSSEDAVARGKEIYGAIGARYVSSPHPTFYMPNGGRVSFRYLDKVDDAAEWQGRNLSDVWVEEAGQYPNPEPIDRLFGVLRSPTGMPIQMILTANPGGAGQVWLRDRFQLWPLPERPKIIDAEINQGTIRACVIPSRITDNRILMLNDPTYVDRLYLVGSKKLVDAWLSGDWSAIEGAFFDEWRASKHLVRPFEIPHDWMRFRSMDWGSAVPFSVGWWAVCPDRHKGIPRGAIVRYREWYGASGPNKGLKMTAEEVADGIRERDAGDLFAYSVLSPDAFSQSGGPSIAERMLPRGITFRKADNRRVAFKGSLGGWDMMRARLKGEDGEPMLYAFDTCLQMDRFIPVQQHDPARLEDMADGEDHLPEEVRYACMSRPWVPAEVREKPKPIPAGHVMLPGPPKPEPRRRFRL